MHLVRARLKLAKCKINESSKMQVKNSLIVIIVV